MTKLEDDKYKLIDNIIGFTHLVFQALISAVNINKCMIKCMNTYRYQHILTNKSYMYMYLSTYRIHSHVYNVYLYFMTELLSYMSVICFKFSFAANIVYLVEIKFRNVHFFPF